MEIKLYAKWGRDCPTTLYGTGWLQRRCLMWSRSRSHVYAYCTSTAQCLCARASILRFAYSVSTNKLHALYRTTLSVSQLRTSVYQAWKLVCKSSQKPALGPCGSSIAARSASIGCSWRTTADAVLSMEVLQDGMPDEGGDSICGRRPSCGMAPSGIEALKKVQLDRC